MREERVKRFESMTADELLSLTRDDFLVSEIHYIVDETRLTRLDRDIANLWLFESMNDEQIAEVVDYDKRTISKHRHLISLSLKKTLVKLFYNGI